MVHEIITGDCLEVMKTFPDNHFSAIVTDPPYGLSFMGKGWDHAVPDKKYFEGIKRICKPGSFLIAMGGTRTFHRLTCAIEDAGWEIRDCISWLYGSGFPKSHNHFGIEGYGTALKPAWEPCIVAMKPCEGTFKQNAEKWGQAGINIGGTRIGTDTIATSVSGGKGFGINFRDDAWVPPQTSYKTQAKGRWPANVIFDEESGALLDQQSGIEASRFFYCPKTSSRERNEGLEGFPEKIGGGLCSTVSGDTRTNHITIQKNNHPTVKPLKLMEYLIKLVMPPKEGLLLDPFAGSGSTILAAKRLGFDAIGIEKCQEYSEIARARIQSANSRLDLRF